ncbi:hypothetical protein [Bacillus thuringiensis]|uniref:hypothetical protein n=1 Tax=Bacillus thuringiensis TaxID=1428 RepID=UPI00119E96BA|nr:hypothetical protein [Bacillus thuringiensis]
MLDNNFNRELKSIIHYIVEYGIKNVSFKVDSIDVLKDVNKGMGFISKVHLGFMKAQKLILQNLLLLGKKRSRVQEQIKELKKQKSEKEIIQKREQDLEIIKYKERVLRKTADAIAWQLLNNDRTVIRRLYKHIPPVEVFNSNVKHDMEAVENIFQDDNTIFPLINDLTSFIQIGDLLVREYNNPRLRLIELKEGKVNEEIGRLIGEYTEFPCDRRLYFQLSEKDTKFHKQFKRYIKQEKRALEATDIINSGMGKDEVTGLDIKIIDDVFYTKHFDDDISTMLEDVDKRNYSLKIIDECLIVGVYNASEIPIYEGFDVWKDSMGIDFPTINFVQFINAPVAFPLFLHPFSINDKVKLINGEKVICMSLDINKWFKLLEQKDMKVNILSKKQTVRLNTVPSHSKSFEYNDQAVEIECGEMKQILHDGIFERMFNQFLKPSSAVDFLKHTFLEGKKDFNKNK